MIPPIYPFVGLFICLVALVITFLHEHDVRPLLELVTRFKRLPVFGMVVVSVFSAKMFVMGSTKPTPPPPPPPTQKDVTISLTAATVSNVTIQIVCTTNSIGLTRRSQARRKMMIENVPVWGAWEIVDEHSLILATNETYVIHGNFVNERRDTQIRVMYGDGNSSNEVTP